MTQNDPTPKRFQVICRPCGRAVASPEVDTLGTTPAEEFMAVARVMQPLGWTVAEPDPAEESAERYLMCPGCSAAAAGDGAVETVLLPVYAAKGPCAKCGIRSGIGSLYRYGNEVQRLYPDEPTCEHILRTCGRCHFRWSEACLSSANEKQLETSDGEGETEEAKEGGEEA
jgi:hypothetical protein